MTDRQLIRYDILLPLMESLEATDITIDTIRGTVYARILPLTDSLVLFLSSTKGFRIGPIALALPRGIDSRGPLSSSLFGMDSEQMMVRVIAEQVSQWLGLPCLAIVSINDLDRQMLMEIVRSLRTHLLPADD